jgi:cell division protein FtsB
VEPQKSEAVREQSEEARQSHWGFRGKTFWNWLDLLVVPIVLALIGFVFTNAQEQAQRLEERNQQLELAAQQAAQARELEEQRAQNAAVQTYFESMRELLLGEDPEDARVQLLIQARTLTVLEGLDPSRKTQVLRFLEEALHDRA